MGHDSIYLDRSARRRASFASAESAARHFAPLVAFVRGVAPPESGGRLLEIGCGTGWATLAFSHAGYAATGIDLADQFEAPGCDLRVGDALDPPFPDDSFDAVVCHQCLEHVPDPRRALDQMRRVCRPGGVVAVVGPNLVSPLLALRFLRFARLRRTPDMPRHPYGNTVGEALAAAVVRGRQLAAKLLSRRPEFLMREPCTLPSHADNDACYLCCPSDLLHYFRAHRWPVLARDKPGRPWPLHLFAGGTRVAARKPLRR